MQPCPQCGKQTVKEISPSLYLTMPPQSQTRQWCGCGWRGEWQTERGLTPDERRMAEWQAINA